MPHVGKGRVLTLVPEGGEHLFKQRLGIGMEQQTAVLTPAEEKIRVSILIVFAAVGLAGRKTVAEHLCNIFCRHLNTGNALGGIVRPVLKMVAVTALMMHPGGAVALGFALAVVGAVVALKVLYTGPELHRGVLGKVVGQPLPVKPQTKAVFAHQCAVVVHGFQMSPEVQGPSPRFGC